MQWNNFQFLFGTVIFATDYSGLPHVHIYSSVPLSLPFSLGELLLGSPPESWTWHGKDLVAKCLYQQLEAWVAREHG